MLAFYIRKFKIKLKKWLKMPVPLQQLALSYIKSNFCVLEAGANDGTDTQTLAQFTRNKVFAFEPVPALFCRLQENTGKIKNIITFQCALADKTHKLKMYVSSGESDGSSSLLEPAEHLNKNPEVLFESYIEVDAFSLDDWAIQQNIKKIDFMWLDMQGYEFKVLKASTNILPTVKVLYTEVSTLELYKTQEPYSVYKDWLISIGFKLIGEELPWGFTGNALFVRNK